MEFKKHIIFYGIQHRGNEKQRKKQHSEAEERRRKTAASATVCHHRCPSRQPDHRHRRSAFLPPFFFFFFFFPAVHCMNSGRELIHAHCSCSRGLRPRYFFEPGLAQFQKLSKNIFSEKFVISRRIFY
jgi:hypothetical protein